MKFTKSIVFLLILLLPIPVNALMYVKGGASLVGEEVIAPAVGIGTRYSLGSIIAVDFSWSLAAAKERKVGMYTSPRVAALLYLNPWHRHRLYVGGSVSWAFIVDAHKKNGFSGALADAIVGIQFDNVYFVHPFIELSQAFPCSKFSSRIGHLGRNPTTTIMIGLGI
jgi:hypothetical protein